MPDETLGNLQAKISIDSSAFEAVQAKAGRFGDSLKGTFGGIAAAVGVGFGLDKAVGLIDESIKAAEGLEVAQRQVNQIFGTSSDTVNKFADGSVQKLGLTKSAALEAMGGMGRMLEGLGIGQQQAADDTVKLQQRIADLASASGKSQDEVTNAIQAGLRGRGMALKNYGIVIDNTKLAQEAMDQGLIKGADTSEKYKIAKEKEAIAQTNYNDTVKKHGENSLAAQKALVTLQTAQDSMNKATTAAVPKLDDQTKAQAALGLIMKDSANTAGDFGSTAADKMQKFHAALDQAKESLGAGLLPVVTQFGDWAASHQTDIEHFATAVGQGLGTAASDLGKVFQFMSDHRQAVIDVAEALTGLYVAGKVKNVAGSVIGDLKDLFGAGGWIIRGVASLGNLASGTTPAGSVASLGGIRGATPANPVWVAMDNASLPAALGGKGGGGAVAAVEESLGAGGIAALVLGSVGEAALIAGGVYLASRIISDNTGSNKWLSNNVLSGTVNSDFAASHGASSTPNYDPITKGVAAIGLDAGEVDQSFRDWVDAMRPLVPAASFIGGKLDDAKTPAGQIADDFDALNSHAKGIAAATDAIGRAMSGAPTNASTLAQRIQAGAVSADLVNRQFDILLGHLSWASQGAQAVGAALNNNVPTAGPGGGLGGFGVNDPFTGLINALNAR